MGALAYYHPFHLLGNLTRDSLELRYSPFYIMAPCQIIGYHEMQIEPGVEILFKHSSDSSEIELYDLAVSDSAKLIAAGTPELNISFDSFDPGVGWKGISYTDADSGYFSYVNIQNVDSSSAITLVNSALVLDNCVFENNTGISGGAVNTLDASLYSLNTTYYNNRASNGGALYIVGGVLQVEHCIFESDSVDTNGGAIALYLLNDVTIKRNIFWLNYSENDGGAIYCQSFTHSDQTQFTNNTFFQNRADHWGGAVYADNNSAFNLENCIL